MLRAPGLSIICFIITFSSEFVFGQKINGVSIVNPPQPIGSAEMSSVKRINTNWIAVIPFGFVRQNQPEVHFDHEHQWWGERVDGSRELIRLAQEEGLSVMLKPHLWMRGGWIGDFDLEDESGWEEWEEDYLDFMLVYAQVAEEMNVPLLCIGTELKKVVVARPEFWRCLIAEIRQVYNGDLTYAANWDNYENIQFWDALDYIGIDAYFVISENADPTRKDLAQGWLPLKKSLKAFREAHDREILFTEYGYQSVNGAAGKHWEVTHHTDHINMDIQCLAYQALFDTFWKEEFFAGGFLWKWHFKENAGGLANTHFTPQGKPVEKIIASFYAEATTP